MTRSRALRFALPAAAALLSSAVGVASWTAYLLNRPRPRTWKDEFSFSPFETQVPYENVSFSTEDGLTIRGWFFPRPETERVVVCCTGHRGAKYELLGIGSGLWRAGNNVLLFDFRGCGDSDPAPISLAHHEVFDARAAVKFALNRVPGARLGILGFSMGAAVSILVAALEPAVLAVVADSSFTSMRDVVAHAIRRHRMPPPVVPLTDVVNRWRYGYSFAAVRPVDVIAHIVPRPTLIIHGSADNLIPVQQGRDLYAAAGEPKYLWVVEGARHCGAYFAARETYVRRVDDFFRRALTGAHVETHSASRNSTLAE